MLLTLKLLPPFEHQPVDFSKHAKQVQIFFVPPRNLLVQIATGFRQQPKPTTLPISPFFTPISFSVQSETIDRLIRFVLRIFSVREVI